MPFTTGELGAGGLLSAALIGFGGWIKSLANRCAGSEDRLKTLEGTVAEKSSQLDVHESNLSVGAKQMESMKAELTTLNKSLTNLHQQGHETASIMEKAVLRLEPQIKALGERIRTDVNEIFLKFNPRIESVEGHVDCLKKKLKDISATEKKGTK